MAKAFARGRPIARLVLSAPERSYLERQVRRHRVARSLSERCRVILRCADGLPSKSVGAELRLHEHTVGKWRRRFLKDRCGGLLDEAPPGPPPTLASGQGAPERRTHNYIRHGTTSLFAALDVASGFVIGKCYKRHRAAEFLNFLKKIDARVAEGLEVHIIMDNYATHKTPKIKAWLARRPHYHVHFTPTSASWINQVERWFAELTRKRLRRGVHTSVRQLQADIGSFIDRHNQK